MKKYATIAELNWSIRCKAPKEGSEEMAEDNYQQIVDYILANQDKFYRLAYSYLHNKENSLDAVQNAIYQALSHYQDLRQIQKVNTWFYRILVRESLEIIRKNKREMLSWEDLPEESYEEAGFLQSESLYQEINGLEEPLQSIIKLHYYEGFTLKEISAILELNENTVKSKLYRGLEMLKKKFKGDVAYGF